jgi:hypothetical protein
LAILAVQDLAYLVFRQIFWARIIRVFFGRAVVALLAIIARADVLRGEVLFIWDTERATDTIAGHIRTPGSRLGTHVWIFSTAAALRRGSTADFGN